MILFIINSFVNKTKLAIYVMVTKSSESYYYVMYIKSYWISISIFVTYVCLKAKVYYMKYSHFVRNRHWCKNICCNNVKKYFRISNFTCDRGWRIFVQDSGEIVKCVSAPLLHVFTKKIDIVCRQILRIKIHDSI